MPPLFLIGFMAAGKTSVGRALARETGRRFIDLDDVIAERGEPVAQLVARDEPEFRRREAAALADVIARGGDPIIATGGGAAAFGDNVERMRAAGLVVALGVDVAEAVKRAAGGPARPLLGDAERLARRRAAAYRRAHAVVDTSERTIDQVVHDVRCVNATSTGRGETIVALGERSYGVHVADEFRAGPGKPTRIALVTDRNVANAQSPAFASFLAPDATIEIEPGEAHKTFATYQHVCEELVALGLDRHSVIVALGGGVVGDLAGFVAATLFRGIAVWQYPTTIVAMTDAAIGGKTAIDLPAGKNLVGAFHQPRVVSCNLATLATLPERERRAGFGELWKYALLDGPALWSLVSACAPTASPSRNVIERAIAYKAAIVGRDERELTGQRALLNLGHTVGHAIEAHTGLHHGEAVGLGLIAACRVSAALGLCAPALETEVAEALRTTGLPCDLSPHLADDVIARIQVDKKRIADKLRFIAVREVGVCEPVEVAVTELRRILRGPSAP